MVLVDTNVLVDVLENDPAWADWSIKQLRNYAQVYELAINPIIYTELSFTFSSFEALDKIITQMELTFVEIPKAALYLAGKAFRKYRHNDGNKSNVLADFFIGAHAAVMNYPLLTRDAKRYEFYFPTLFLITPEKIAT